MKNFWISSFFTVFVIVLNTSDLYAQFVVSKESNQNFSKETSSRLEKKEQKETGMHFGVWVNYQQQFGALGDKFMTIGGPSFGFNLGRHFFLGGGVYTSFGQSPLTANKDHSLIYGGGILGIRWNPKQRMVFRTQVLVGAVGFDTVSREVPGLVENRTTSLIVAPEVGFDLRIVGHLYLSASATYRYVHDLPDAWEKFEKLGALAGSVSLGLSF